MKEQDLLNQVMTWLTINRIMCWRNNTTGVFDPTKKRFRRPSRWSRSGVSDIIGIIPSTGKILCIELKRPPTGKRSESALINMLSDNQKLFINEINANNGVAFVADSLDTVIDKVTPLIR